MSKVINNQLHSGSFRYKGYIGKKIDLYSQKRLLGEGAWEKIYPETEKAFRKRVDDQLQAGSGLWQGEFWGKHVLSALDAIKYYDDESLLDKLKMAGEGLVATQEANGYIGTYADSRFTEGNAWNIWCRKYTLWGLVALYQKTQYSPFLTAAIQFLNHIIEEVGPHGKPIIQTGNFFGLPSTSILQPVIELYQLSGEQKHLDFALYIVEQWSQHPEGIPNLLQLGLKNKPIHQWFDNPFDWAKGYEFISCVEGLLALYQLVGNPDYLQAVINIHQQLSDWEQSFIGSVSFDDKLMGARFFKNTFSEICDNIYWNRLNYSLFMLTGDAKYADQFELTFYNGILIGMKPDGTWGLRRQRVSHEHIPATPHCYLKHHQCCTTNLPRGLYQAGDISLCSDEEGLRISMYGAGKGYITLENGIKVNVEIKGDYPFNGDIKLIIQTNNGSSIPIKLRKPSWCKQIKVKLDGKELPVTEKDSWVKIAPQWQSGDVLELNLGNPLHAKFFDCNMGGHSHEMIEWHKDLWIKRGYFAEDGVKQQSNLTPKDPRNENAAVSFFLGPLALARDIRLGDEKIFSSIKDSPDASEMKLEATESPEGIERSYLLVLATETIRLCDYPSAGNTWDKNSCFSTWIEFE